MNILFSWLIALVVFIVISIFIKKRNFHDLFKGILLFSIYYLIAYFIGSYLFNIFGHVNLNYLNSISIGIISTIIWFLFVFFIQKKSLIKSLKSSGIYLLFYLLAEVIYNVLQKF
jgi:hypothetical protein|tara:strand:+ start:155 stop:499 length:345 start_codon:yes stop_codon:yes gene_type:complete